MGLAELYAMSIIRPEPAPPPQGEAQHARTAPPKRGRKKRAGKLTILAVAVGVFSVTVISGAGKIGESQVSRMMDGMGINTVLIEPEQSEGMFLSVKSAGRNGQKLSESDLSTVADTEGIAAAAPLLSAPAVINLHGYSRDTVAWGTDTTGVGVFSMSAGAGRFFSDGDVASRAKVCVLDKKIAAAAYGRSNITGKYAQISIGGKTDTFKVIGTSDTAALASAMSGLVPDFVYMPYTTLQDLTGSYGYDRIAATAGSAESASGAKKNLSADITDRFRRHGRTGGVSVIDLLSQKETLLNLFGTVAALLSVIAGISLLVSGLSVMTAMLTRVAERRREIGIKKSIGASPLRVMSEFLAESLTLSAKGAALGGGTGIAVTAAACVVLGIPPIIDVNAVIFAAAAALLCGSIFGVYPAAVAAKMPPIKALLSVEG